MVQISQWFQLYLLMDLLMDLFSCIYLLVDWLYLLISSFLWVLYLGNQSPICKDSQLLMQTLGCTYKCKNTASFPSLPTQIQHSTHWGSIQAMIWNIFFNSQKKKSPCVKSTISLTTEKHLEPPWWPVVKALCFQRSGSQFNPWSGSKNPTCRLTRPERKKTSGNKTYVQRCFLQYYL